MALMYPPDEDVFIRRAMHAKTSESHRRALSSALQEMRRGLEASFDRHMLMQYRIDELLDALDRGESLASHLMPDDGAVLARLISQDIEMLVTSGAEVRRWEAQVLSDEGMSHDGIATLFGVARQRISKILQERRAE